MASEEPLHNETALWSQLNNAVTLVAKQDQIVWTVFGVFWAANAVLLVALFTTGNLPGRPAGIIVSGVGVALSAVWWLIQRRAIGYLDFYGNVMRRLEERLLDENHEIALSGGLNSSVFGQTVNGPRVRPLMRLVCLLFIIGWLVAVAYFLFWVSSQSLDPSLAPSL